MRLRTLAPIPLLAALGCAEPAPLIPVGTTRAPGVLLMAQLDGTGAVTIQGTYRGPLTVDVDGTGDPLAAEDARYAFRYLVQSGSEVLYSRSTPGPVIVKEFLDHYGGSVDIDILAAFPGLGEFPVMIPDLPTADLVRFEIRDEEGVYQEVGSYDLARVDGEDMGPSPVAVGSVPLHKSGASDNRLDLVLMGDGYTEAELGLWESDAALVAETLLGAEPFTSLSDFINITRVDAVSAESGVSFDCVDDDCRMKETAFGTVFAIEAVNRMLGTDYRTTPVFQLEQWEVARAAATVPWDMVLLVANAEHDAGFAVHYATVSHHDAWEQTAVHELGHTIGLLGDEYTSDDCVRSNSLGLPDNITDDPENVPWSAWVEAGTPLPTPDERDWREVVGAFSPAYNCEDLYRPAHTCRMEDSDEPFCPVCTELLVRRVMRFADPVDAIVEGKEGELTLESPWSDLEVAWALDGVPAGSGRSVSVSEADTVSVRVKLLSEYVREDRGDLEETWGWQREEAE